MQRRRFLAIGGTSTLALLLPEIWARDATRQPLARPELVSLFEDAARVRELGRRYRSRTPDENTREAVIEALRSTFGTDPTSVGPSRIEKQIRADFDAGRTVVLDGWVLSRTEARQCALFSLT